MAGSRGRQWVRRSHAQANEFVERFERSGLTRQAFCQREGIALSSLQRWCRQRDEVRGSASSSDEHEAAFVDLGALAGPGGAGFEIRLELGAGVVLHLVRR